MKKIVREFVSGHVRNSSSKRKVSWNRFLCFILFDNGFDNFGNGLLDSFWNIIEIVSLHGLSPSCPEHHHCVKSVCIRIFSGPYFFAFELYTEGYSVTLRIQSECGKIRPRKTPNKDTFHAVHGHFVIPCLSDYPFG